MAGILILSDLPQGSPAHHLLAVAAIADDCEILCLLIWQAIFHLSFVRSAFKMAHCVVLVNCHRSISVNCYRKLERTFWLTQCLMTYSCLHSERQNSHAFYDLALKITLHFFFNILFVTHVSPTQCEWDCQWLRISGSRTIWYSSRTPWRLTPTEMQLKMFYSIWRKERIVTWVLLLKLSIPYLLNQPINQSTNQNLQINLRWQAKNI